MNRIKKTQAEIEAEQASKAKKKQNLKESMKKSKLYRSSLKKKKAKIDQLNSDLDIKIAGQLPSTFAKSKNLMRSSMIIYEESFEQSSLMANSNDDFRLRSSSSRDIIIE